MGGKELLPSEKDPLLLPLDDVVVVTAEIFFARNPEDDASSPDDGRPHGGGESRSDEERAERSAVRRRRSSSGRRFVGGGSSCEMTWGGPRSFIGLPKDSWWEMGAVGSDRPKNEEKISIIIGVMVMITDA